ncbi:MAG: SDR family NAD(P)-dependent oxidoreductase [Deltaproteobacteria bacterium]|nr:SDR family NAD(P)-dependent oxidoreductase [Deltaproteobacteria bacterium]
MEIAEPTIAREDILFLDDPDFNPDHVCIITGAAGGIGRAACIAAAANNLMTVGLDVNEEEGNNTVKMAREMGGQMIFIKTDLTKDSEMEYAVAEAAKMGTIRYLVNVAGIQHIDYVEDFPIEKYDLMQSIMVRAPFYLSKLTIPHMKRSKDGRGVIGHMASVHAHISTICKSSYNITKFGLRALAQSISAEGDGRVRSFTVSTGFVRTALALNQIPAQAKKRGISHEQVVRDVMMGSSRLKEMMSPIEVANLFMFGFSRFAKYLVGGDLLFDGGMVLTYCEARPPGQ